jgi:hypothetical protein
VPKVDGVSGSGAIESAAADSKEIELSSWSCSGGLVSAEGLFFWVCFCILYFVFCEFNQMLKA